MLTLYSMTKIWAEAFWKSPPEGMQERPADPKLGSLAYMVLPIAVLSVSTLVIGLFGEPLFLFAERAADQLLNPQSYIDAVFAVEMEVPK